jgi:hypothetical protein
VPGAAKWQRAAEFAASTALPAAARLHAAAVAERDEARKRAAEADKRVAQVRLRGVGHSWLLQHTWLPPAGVVNLG